LRNTEVTHFIEMRPLRAEKGRMDGRTDRRTDRRPDRRPDRHDEAKSRFS